mgnify:CR=1 FL=1
MRTFKIMHWLNEHYGLIYTENMNLTVNVSTELYFASNDVREIPVNIYSMSENKIKINSWSAFVCVCLGFFIHPTREFFPHTETSPLPMKGCKF